MLCRNRLVQSRFRTHVGAKPWASLASLKHRTLTTSRGYVTQAPAQTEVEKILLDTIKATGPISYATYMQLCLSHPTEGYYMNPSNPVFGKQGDFITSPEISQVFGELIAIWLIIHYTSTAPGRKIRLIELGPGRGTLMQDVLRVFSRITATQEQVTEVMLVETSPAMRALQEEKLEGSGFKLTWFNSIDEIPRDEDQFTMIVAHEFFDALPFHLLEKTHSGWREVLITSASDPAAPTILKASGSSLTSTDPPFATPSKKSRFRPVLAPNATFSATTLGASSPRFASIPVGGRLEVSPTSFKVAKSIGELLRHDPDDESTPSLGCGLFVDYGGDKAYGNSFRGFRKHKIVDVFNRPGKCDLTVNVDFAFLKEAFSNNVITFGPITQYNFLTGMGLNQRLWALQRSALSEDRKSAIQSSAKRLIDLTGMGIQYSFLGFSGLWGKSDSSNQVGYPRWSLLRLTTIRPL
ncbi:Protein arginine methyltransferase NDUFAF7 [Abortiporus biennis]